MGQISRGIFLSWDLLFSDDSILGLAGVKLKEKIKILLSKDEGDGGKALSRQIIGTTIVNKWVGMSAAFVVGVCVTEIVFL